MLLAVFLLQLPYVCDFNDVAKNLNLNNLGFATEVRPKIDPNRPNRLGLQTKKRPLDGFAPDKNFRTESQ